MNRQLYSYEFDNLSQNSPVEDTKTMVPMTKKDKPKRNRSAFIIFSSEMRPLIKSENGQKLNSNEMMVKLADLWKGLKEEERKKYNDMAEKEKVKYLLELNQFYQTHPFDVIQNKTKNNHVKKPCSAYGLFLKETKKVVKAEQPDLKMADVLKIVAQRWKALDDNKRRIYQEQAKVEKEVVKAKINEHASDEEKLYAASLPQKRLQSQKRVKKALLRETVKFNNVSSPDNLKMEELDTSDSSPFEEAVFAQLSESCESEVANTFTPFPTDDMLFDSICAFNLNLNKIPSIEPIFQTIRESTHEKVERLPDLAEMKTKKSNDFLMDILNFHNIQDNTTCIKQASTFSTNGALNFSAKPSRQFINDTLINALDFGYSAELDFDCLNVNTLSSFFYLPISSLKTDSTILVASTSKVFNRPFGPPGSPWSNEPQELREITLSIRFNS